MKQVHKIKIQQQYADVKLAGDKNWEIRLNDRNYQKGDIVRYQVVDDVTSVEIYEHPLNAKVFEITYVYSGAGIQSGVVVFSDKDITTSYNNDK